MKRKFKFLEHTADVKFRAFGKTLNEVFKNSALALKEVICEKTKIKGKKKKKISAKGKDYEALLYRFLEEILYLLDADEFIIAKVENVKINKEKFELTAVIKGDKTSNYKFSNPAKAITYNDMFVKNLGAGKGWIAQVVVDV